jgi:hypothetical protein
MASIDPDIGAIALLMDQRLANREQIRAQREQIRAPVSALRAQQRAMCALITLVDMLVRSPGD